MTTAQKDGKRPKPEPLPKDALAYVLRTASDPQLFEHFEAVVSELLTRLRPRPTRDSSVEEHLLYAVRVNRRLESAKTRAWRVKADLEEKV